jgi:hypothetical protein
MSRQMILSRTTVALFLPERCAIWMFLAENIKSVRQTSRQHCEKMDLWLQERPRSRRL